MSIWNKIKQEDAIYEIVRRIDDKVTLAYAMTRSTYLQLSYIQQEVANGPAYRRFNEVINNRLQFVVSETEASELEAALAQPPTLADYPLMRSRGRRQDVVIVSVAHFSATAFVIRQNAKERTYRPFRAKRLEPDTGWRQMDIPARQVEYQGGHYHSAWQRIGDPVIIECVKAFLKHMQEKGARVICLVARSSLTLFTCDVHILMNVDDHRLILLHIGK